MTAPGAEMVSTTETRIWTYEDLFSLPDDGKRYEIIAGELYEMPSPSYDHAAAIINLIFILGPIVRALGGSIVTAPLDVFFADANPVQPDIVVLLPDRLKYISRRGVEGPPDLLIEVLSPSNPEHDRQRKRALYARGGVREYWIVSPEAGTIEVLVLEGDSFRTLSRAGADEPVRSSLFPELEFRASDIFASSVSA